MKKQKKKQHVYVLFHFPTNRILGIYSTAWAADSRCMKLVSDDEWKDIACDYATLEFSVQGTNVVTTFNDRELVRVFK